MTGTDAFADGEAIVTIYLGNTIIANTTTLDVDRWNFTYSVPFTNGELDFRIEITPLNGSGVTEYAHYERMLFSMLSIQPSLQQMCMHMTIVYRAVSKL